MKHKLAALRVFTMLFVILGFYSCQKEKAFTPSQSKQIRSSVEQSNYFVFKKEVLSMADDLFITKGKGLKSKANTSQNRIKEVFPVVNKKSEKVFYIVNYEQQGFVILAADKRSTQF